MHVSLVFCQTPIYIIAVCCQEFAVPGWVVSEMAAQGLHLSCSPSPSAAIPWTEERKGPGPDEDCWEWVQDLAAVTDVPAPVGDVDEALDGASVAAEAGAAHK